MLGLVEPDEQIVAVASRHLDFPDIRTRSIGRNPQICSASHRGSSSKAHIRRFAECVRLSIPRSRRSAIYDDRSRLTHTHARALWRVGKDGIEAGTRLVPDSVPRPIARISVVGVAVLVSLFLLKSILSTAFFVLAMMGLIYTAFIAMNKDEGPISDGGSTNTEDTLEEARRIMEKYK
ncbi:hypothetical protein Scep_010450 [Stephania cephalantha]|uniref:Uncharacterized protein n=1 Tax=Stephania cephalantha TaxID=152367 RepID=A0AAP0PF84_9MAGN